MTAMMNFRLLALDFGNGDVRRQDDTLRKQPDSEAFTQIATSRRNLMTSIEGNKAVIRRFYEQAWNQKQFDILEETHAPDWIHHDPSNPLDLRGGSEGNRARLMEVSAAFPDVHLRLDDLIAEDDQVAVRFTISGTHAGPFAGIPATGKQISVQGMIVHRLQDGKIVEDWAVRDTLGLLQQLGVIPMPSRMTD